MSFSVWPPLHVCVSVSMNDRLNVYLTHSFFSLSLSLYSVGVPSPCLLTEWDALFAVPNEAFIALAPVRPRRVDAAGVGMTFEVPGVTFVDVCKGVAGAPFIWGGGGETNTYQLLVFGFVLSKDLGTNVTEPRWREIGLALRSDRSSRRTWCASGTLTESHCCRGASARISCRCSKNLPR